MILHNVHDRRRQWIGSWEIEPLVYDRLTDADVGRTVIYRSPHRIEAATLSSWRNGWVFARYGHGDTAATASAESLVFGIRPLDGPGSTEPDLGAARAGMPARW